MAGYTRTDTTNNIATGLVINAADFDGEYNAIETAFNATGGHAHDGVAGGGARILKLGPSGDLTISAGAVTPLSNNAIDLGTSGAQFKDLFIDGVGYIDAMDGDVLFGSTVGASKLQFRDTAIYINSSADGQLDLVADTEIQIAATTIDMNGNVNVSGSLTIGGAGISEAELEILDGASLSTIELNYLEGTTLGTVVASKVLAVDSNKDITGFRNISLTGTVDGIDIATRDAVLTSTTTTAGAALPKAGGALTGAVTTNSTFDGVDIATRDGVLTSTTTTANAALPKTGGAMTGAITTNSTFDGRDVAADGVLATNALPKGGGAMTGAITTNSTFDGVDIATRDAILTSTTTTAGAALPKTGGAMTGAITTNSTFDGVDIATRDAILTSTTTTAGAALPKSGGAMTGDITGLTDLNVGATSAPGTLDVYGAFKVSNAQNDWFTIDVVDTLSAFAGHATLANSDGNIYFKVGSENSLILNMNGGVSLYYNNLLRLHTHAGGATITGTVTNFYDTTADASAGPDLKLDRGSATPANSDYLGNLQFFGRSSNGTSTQYGHIRSTIYGVTQGSTRGNMYIDALDTDGVLYTGLGVSGKQTTLYYSDSARLLTTSAGLTVTGNMIVSGTVTENSDERLKDNITTISGALDLVSDMRGVTYDKDGRAGVGVIAQEIQKVLPELVSEPADGEYLSVAYGNISGVLIEAIKELRAEVDHLSKTACTCKCTCKTPEV